MPSRKEPSLFVSVVGVLVATLFAGLQAVFAQVDTGAILGTVRDQSGAVVPGAKVTLLNEGTGLPLTATTAADGAYIFTPLKIGVYSITVEREGFQRVTRSHVTLDVQQQVKVDVTLVPGQVTQTIEVTGAAPLLETQTSSVGQTVGGQAVNDLPLNGRNYTFLAQLVAGTSQTQPTGRGLEFTGSFTANGLPLVHNNYILDGIDNNNDTVDFLNGASFAVLSPPDAIQEFKVQTSNFSAEFGRAGGAVVNATIKSGTNQVHGSLWEFVRNDIFDAANFFENSPTHIEKGEFRRNQFGGAIGGPVYIPHVYNGKDKTFFFADFEATRIRQGSPQLANVPTAQERASGYTNLQELINPSFQSGTQVDVLQRTFPLGTVFDPATTRTVTMGVVDPVTGITAPATGMVRDPFYGASLVGATDFTTPAAHALLNMLPASRLGPNAISLLNLYPAPTTSGLFNNFSQDRVIQDDTGHFDARIDHNFSEKDQMFGRMSYSDRPYFLPGPFTGVADGGAFNTGDFKDVGFNSALSETHSFSPTLINEFRFGYSRIHTTQLQPFGDKMGVPAEFGIQGIPQLPANGGLPRLDISGLSSLGAVAFLPGNRVSDTLQLTENLTKVYGSHAFKGGLEYQSLRHPWLAPAWSRGEFQFNGAYTEVLNTGNGNTGLAQLMLSPAATAVPNGFDNVGGSQFTFASNFAGPDDIRHYYGLYFQDDWKVNHKLTLNLGLRWEFFGSIGENYGAQANFIPKPSGAGAEYLITDRRKNEPLSPSFLSTLSKDGISLGYSSLPGLVNTPTDNFAPRIGFAYQITPKLVARGAYGIFYGGFEDIGGAPDIGENYPFLYDFFFFAPDGAHPTTYPDGSIGTLENGLAGVALSPTAVNGAGLALQGWQTDYKTPNVQEYNLMFQYQLTPNDSLQLGYLGNNSHHLLTSPGLNSPSVILPPGVDPHPYVAFPDFGLGATYVASEANSHYNALQLTYQRRLSTGLSVLANYTYSQCRGNYTDLLGINGNKGLRAPYLPGFGIQADFGLCGEDVRNVVHVSGTYQLPLGSGRRFGGSASGAWNQLIGGWSINWILSLQGGFPFTVYCPTPTSYFGCFALLVPGQNIYAGPHNVDQWLNPAAFANPPVATAVGQKDYAPLGGAPTQAYGPSFRRLDLSAFKAFRTSERTHLEFRAEFFNLTNTPQFANPSYLDFTNKATFGRITSLRDGVNDPRQIQFALKFYW